MNKKPSIKIPNKKIKKIAVKSGRAYVKAVRSVKGVKPSEYRENSRANFRESFKSNLYD